MTLYLNKEIAAASKEDAGIMADINNHWGVIEDAQVKVSRFLEICQEGLNDYDKAGTASDLLDEYQYDLDNMKGNFGLHDILSQAVKFSVSASGMATEFNEVTANEANEDYMAEQVYNRDNWCDYHGIH